MEFYKETIMGQVLHQVQADNNNEIYLERLDELMNAISDAEYVGVETPAWSKNGLVITDRAVDVEMEDPDWIFVETSDVAEYSWFIEELMNVYQPKINDVYRLLSTVGYLLNVYTDKYDDISDIFRITAISSTVFLHPDHLGLDKFVVHPISLPAFGSEF